MIVLRCDEGNFPRTTRIEAGAERKGRSILEFSPTLYSVFLGGVIFL